MKTHAGMAVRGGEPGALTRVGVGSVAIDVEGWIRSVLWPLCADVKVEDFMTQGKLPVHLRSWLKLSGCAGFFAADGR